MWLVATLLDSAVQGHPWNLDPTADSLAHSRNKDLLAANSARCCSRCQGDSSSQNRLNLKQNNPCPHGEATLHILKEV